MNPFIREASKNIIGEDVYRRIRRKYQILKKESTGPLRSLPNFIIVGAQKSGTSSLYRYISSHSKVVPATGKEVHFFDKNFEKGVNWYRSHFPLSVKLMMEGAITGEATPYYLYHPQAPRRIASVVPEVKLIILLRNPVDRAISHYWHEVNRTGAESLSMKEAFIREEERLKEEKEKLKKGEIRYSRNHQRYSYKDRGNYIEQIESYRKFFSDEQIKIVKSSRLFNQTQSTFDEITDYLDIRREILENEDPEMTGNYQKEADPSIRKYLEDHFSDHNRKLKEKFGISFKHK